MLNATRNTLRTLSLCLLSPLLTGQIHARSEPEIKAAYIYNFIKFVQWPGEQTHSTINVCTLDDSVMAHRLEPLHGQTLRNQDIHITHISYDDRTIPAQLEHCSVLYVGRASMEHLPSILDRVKAQPMLLISDIDGFANRGGMIEFVTLGDVVRFNINVRSAREAQMSISSKLLELANQVVQ
jgi:hypothetical protein